MKAIINGVEGNRLGLFKGADSTLIAHLINDDGSVLALTGGTVSFDVYDTKDRRNTAVKTKAATLTTAATGYITVTLLAADMDFGPSVNDVPYYGFFKFTASGAAEYVGLTPVEIIIK